MRPVADLVADLRALGVQPGYAVMAHASLRRMGPVEGGPAGVIAALDAAVGADGGWMMTLGAANAWDWVNEKPEAERAALLADAIPFDPATTPAEGDVGYLAEAFRQAPSTLVTDNPEGRFGARGSLAAELLRDAPWNDYYGHGSPLQRLCEFGGAVLRLGADPDTVTLLHYAEYLAPLPDKRRVTRHRRVLGPDGPIVRTVSCLDDSDGIVDWAGEDYFALILKAYLAEGRGARGRVGGASAELLDARDLVAFGAAWMGRNLA
ncbi:MAG TPA: AAC(3) family N-acetyltransferase [Phytomonospora sp.]